MQELYQRIKKAICEYMQLNVDACILTNAWGYRGFSCLHHCNAETLFCQEIELCRELWDNHRTIPPKVAINVDYNPNTLKEHLAFWDTTLEKIIVALGKCSSDYFNATGCQNKIISNVLECLWRDYKKVKMWHDRFAETDWLVHDMRVVDDLLYLKVHKD